MTSSIMKSAPYWSQISRMPCKKPSFGGIQFMLPATASIITQAMSLGNSSNNFLTESRLLYSAVKVCLAKSSGTPGELG